MQMQLNDFFNYLFGYQNIEIEGEYAEDFLNCAAEEDAEIWHIRRKDCITLTARSRIFDTKKILEVAEKAKVEVRICDKKGMPPIFKKYRLRYGLFAGVAVILIFMAVVSSFIWKIDIIGNSVITVSYTHLDVYKRQSLLCIKSDLNKKAH